MGFSSDMPPLIVTDEVHDSSSEQSINSPVDPNNLPEWQGEPTVANIDPDLVVPPKKATVVSSWANLTNTILGAGMLGIPFAVAKAGTILGVVLLLFCMCMAALGLHFLGETSAILQTRGVTATYFKTSMATYPWAKVIIDLAIFVKCFGVAAGYLIVCGGLMPQVTSDIWADAPDWLSDATKGRYFWIGVSSVIVIPLAFMKNINKLRYSSSVALFSTLYLVFLIFYYFFNRNEARNDNANFHHHGSIRLDLFPTSALDLIPNLPIFVFAFTCHQNLFSIFNELPNAAGVKINTVIGSSTFSCFCVYVLLGLFGYFTFGSTVNSNITVNYPDTTVVTVGRIAITLNVLLSYALQAHPARNSLDSILFPSKQDEKTNTRYVIETISIIIVTYAIAFSVKSLGVVFSVVGATGSTTICYILPGFFYWKITEDHGLTAKRIAALCMGIGGFCFMCVALTFIILSAAHVIDVPLGG